MPPALFDAFSESASGASLGVAANAPGAVVASVGVAKPEATTPPVFGGTNAGDGEGVAAG